MTTMLRVSLGLVVSASILLSACGDDQETVKGAHDANASALSANKLPATLDTMGDKAPDNSTVAAVAGASEIPYPVYPNGSKYRVGGENGLKIVVFETRDTFEQVDEFYKSSAEPDTMPRLLAMNDYVRYGSSGDDKDPWATYRPGIVIHQFNDDAERNAVGAKPDSRTNIIMSY